MALDTRRDRHAENEFDRMIDEVPDDRLLLIKQAASSLHRSRMTIHRMMESGELQVVRTGKVRRIPREEVLAYLRRMKADNSDD